MLIPLLKRPANRRNPDRALKVSLRLDFTVAFLHHATAQL